ncbi:MAG: PorV/PorQ family protein [Bacteroidota bacterium]
MKKLIICSLTLVINASGLMAQAPKYSNEFLAIGVGARSLSMSNSVIGSVNDVTSGYWNPAGLMGLGQDLQVGLMHAEYFAGIAKYDYGSVAKKIDSSSAFGISIIRFGVDDIPNTTELIDANGNIDYDRITTFSAADYAFIASYARKLGIEGLTVGGNFKIVHRKVGDFGKSWGFGLDVSAQYKYKEWLFGAMARDITTTFNAWSYDLSEEMINTFAITGNEIPENSTELTLPRLLLGAGRNFKLGEKFTLMGEVDLDMTFDGKRNVLIKSNFMSIDPHMGLEAGFKNIVFLRAGLGNIQKVTEIDNTQSTIFQPNIGVGLKIKRISLDYALTDIGDQSVALYSNIFSLKFDISKNGGS